MLGTSIGDKKRIGPSSIRNGISEALGALKKDGKGVDHAVAVLKQLEEALADKGPEQQQDIDDPSSAWYLRLFTDGDPSAAETHSTSWAMQAVSSLRPGSAYGRGVSQAQLTNEVQTAFLRPEVQAVLKKAGGIDFDAYKLSLLPEVDGRPLSVLGYTLLSGSSKLLRMICSDSVGIQDKPRFKRASLSFLGKLDVLYRPDVKYHGVAHACDVMNTMEWFLRSELLTQRTTVVDRYAALMAAALHDVAHPGNNNLYETSTMSELAVRYNDRSVLENFHISLSFEAMRQDDECNWFALLPKEAAKGSKEGTTTGNLQQYVRKILINMVLATDMAKHAQAKSDLDQFVVDTDDIDKDEGKSVLQKQKALESDMFLLSAALHAADISNPTKPRTFMLQWTHLILQEFWQQGDIEKQRGFPISPLCDREAGLKSVAKGQLGFINFVVQPFFVSMTKLIPETEACMAHLQETKVFWDEKDKEGASYEDIFRECLEQERQHDRSRGSVSSRLSLSSRVSVTSEGYEI